MNKKTNIVNFFLICILFIGLLNGFVFTVKENTENIQYEDNQFLSSSDELDIDQIVHRPEKTEIVSNGNEITNPEKISSANSVFQINSLNSISTIINVSDNQLVRSGQKINISITENAPYLEYLISENRNDILSNISDVDQLLVTVPTLDSGVLRSTIYLRIFIYNSTDKSVFLYAREIILLLDDYYVNIVDYSVETKYAADSLLTFDFDVQPNGVNWKWDTGEYSGSPFIRTPMNHGEHTLYLIIIDQAGRQQLDDSGFPYEFKYFVDTEAPDLSPLVDFNSVLKAGSQILFQNVTPSTPVEWQQDPFADKTKFFFNFTTLDIFTNDFPKVPIISHGSYVLKASVQDEIGNFQNATYIVQIGVAILDINPKLSGKPGGSISVNISEDPLLKNFTWYYPSGIIYNSSTIGPPNLPLIDGDFTFEVFVEDLAGNTDFASVTMRVDSVPLGYVITFPENNSELYFSDEIFPKFNETPAFLYWYWNNEGVNNTGDIFLPENSTHHNLTIFAGDLAKNFIQVNLTFLKHISQELISPSTNGATVEKNFNVTITFSESYQTLFIHWDNAQSNGSFINTPTVSTSHSLNVTTISNLGIITSYQYNFIVKIDTFLFIHEIGERLSCGSFIPIQFSDGPSLWASKWDSDSIYTRFNQTPVAPCANGPHTLSIVTYNYEGTGFVESFNFFVDMKNPQVSLLPSVAQKIKSGGLVNLTISDPDCSIASCIANVTYSWNNVQNKTLNFNNSLPLPLLLTIPDSIPNLSNEINNLSIYVFDYTSNLFKNIYSYQIDDNAPIIINSLIINNSIFLPHQNTSIDFLFDEVVSEANITFLRDDEIIESKIYRNMLDYSLEANIIGYGNASLKVILSIEDNLGNKGNYLINLILKDKALLVQTDYQSLTRSGTDVLFFLDKPIKEFRASWINETSYEIISDTLNSTTPLADGKYVYNFSIKDYQDIWYNNSLSFIIDNEAPRFSFINGLQIKNNSLVSFNINNSGLDMNLVNLTNPQDLTFIFSDDISMNNSVQVTFYSNDTLLKSQFYTNITNEFLLSITNMSITKADLEFTLSDELGNTVKFVLKLSFFQVIEVADENGSNDDVLSIIIGGVLVAIPIVGVSSYILYARRKK